MLVRLSLHLPGHARFIDTESQAVSTRFLSFQQLVDHPNAENIYQGIMQVIGLSLPLQKLVGFTCDRASVMISSNQGVLGKLRRAVNPKLLSTHCPPHRLVLASEAAAISTFPVTCYYALHFFPLHGFDLDLQSC